MCNLYRLSKSHAEIARLFRVEADLGANVGEEVYPGYPGLVIAEGRARSMVWGFPLTMKSKRTGEPLKPKPVNNTRADKLDSFFWRFSFGERRCLIPLSAFAEAEGPRGAKTRTWIGLPDAEAFAVAGIWRDSDEWGPVYSMVMTEACADMDGIHDRMPVILAPDRHRQWQDGAPTEASALCAPWPGALAIDRTHEKWAR